MTVAVSPAQEILLQTFREYDEVERATAHPAEMLRYTRGVDAKTGENFEFRVGETWTNSLGELIAGDEDDPWFWQREQLDAWLLDDKSIILKARQLGITWLAGGYALWLALFRPGTRILVVSINEAEASKVVNRIWDMFLALPAHFKRGIKVVKPALAGGRPYDQIQLQHPDGKISTILGLPSTKKAGHGETAALVILDEASRQEYARETWKAVIPTMAGGGKIFVISTANGVSNDLTGEGNFFHHLWVHSDDYQIARKFLSWRMHPDRDDEWYQREAMAMPAKDRAEQFPDDPHEAFILTGDVYFDVEAMDYYSRHAKAKPLYRMNFAVKHRRARVDRLDKGWTTVYREPVAGGQYAIAADVASGRGLDFSCASVIDLSDMTTCAEFHAKCDYDQYAEQLHFLGRWYNTARIAVETGGGFGDAVIIFLRDGKEGRPAYPKLYRHRQASRADLAEHKPFGFPMNSKTRPLVLEYMEKALRERSVPCVSEALLSEMSTFVYRTTNPSPRAQDGCNDDRVMAAAIAYELFRQYGTHPKRVQRKGRKPLPSYPWLDN